MGARLPTPLASHLTSFIHLPHQVKQTHTFENMYVYNQRKMCQKTHANNPVSVRPGNSELKAMDLSNTDSD